MFDQISNFSSCYQNILLSTVTDSRQIDLPTPTQEVWAQQQHIEKECIPRAAKEDPVILPVKEEQAKPCITSSAPVGKHEGNKIPDSKTQVVTIRDYARYEEPDSING